MKLLPWPWGEYTDIRPFDAYNVSINSRSQVKEEAWEFVKFLLAEDTQFYLSERNFAVNRKADEKRIAVFDEELEKYNLLGEDNIKAISYIKNSINKNRALGVPDELFNTIWNEIKIYLSGSRSIEETAKVIQNKVELYLNE
jgi:multiple sugar transport system substrate-binding protein